MFPRLLALFIGLPLIEMIILIKLGEVIGFWPTLGLVVVTGVVGASLARVQGFLVYRRIQTELQMGRMPAAEMLDGLLVLIGGIVLLTPGLLTDIFGLLLMVPVVRRALRDVLRKRFEGMVTRGQTTIFYRDVTDYSRREDDPNRLN